MTTTKTGTDGTDAPALDTMSELDRRAAFDSQAHRAAIPRKVIVWIVVVLVVLALGGTLGEKLLSAAGVNPTVGKARPAPLPALPQVSAPLASFMSLVDLGAHAAPGFSLTTESGAPLALSSLKGRIVVLSFFDARCRDICPVLAKEIEAADASLKDPAKVEFLSVDTNPLVTSVAAAHAVAERTGLAKLANWHFLVGPFASLEPVWAAYGITVDVDSVSGATAHNDELYFIDPAGRLVLRATPFADESRTGGAWSLPAALSARWSTGIATEIERLAR